MRLIIIPLYIATLWEQQFVRYRWVQFVTFVGGFDIIAGFGHAVTVKGLCLLFPRLDLPFFEAFRSFGQLFIYGLCYGAGVGLVSFIFYTVKAKHQSLRC